MKKLFLIPLLFLAACAPTVNSTPSLNVCADGGVASSTLIDEKAYAGALILYNVPAQAYVSLDQRGRLSADVKAKAKPILIKMYDTLLLVRQAYIAGNTSDFGCQLGALERSASLIKPLLGVQ